MEGSRLSCGQLWISKLVPQKGCGPQPLAVFLVFSWAASAATAPFGIAPIKGGKHVAG